jgi:cytoskeleton protein RodZ
MDSIGERLRQERLRRGFDLQQIAEFTKINIVMLEAIEADDLESLPGIFFTRSFVRQYARALDLDEASFESELNRLAACESVPTLEDQPAAREDFDVPPMRAARPSSHWQRPLGSLAALLFIVGACSAIFMYWQRSREFKPAASILSVPAPQPPRPPVQPAAVPSQPPPVPAPAASTTTEPPAETAASSQPPPASATTEPPAETAANPLPPATAKPALPAEATPEPAPAVRLHVRLHATAPAWVRIAVDGKYSFSGVLQPGEIRNVDATQLVQLRVGDAAALEVFWNGQPVAALGPKGQARNVEFTPDGFNILAPRPPAPEPPADAP